ncbi:uncharacterized protein LOC134181007 [Corticium candelabrum]|uniref:uncharacterized protein LOC134181007 n=1 Tax=Corticium candelabrum TaxID=121492 RepID=UPI002E26C79B|nr:uncharacterized protein LOC134181007 [Corticium candelabrum]
MSELPSNDAELRIQLAKHGVDVGPINDSTRGLYQKLLKNKLSQSKPSASRSSSTQKPKRRPKQPARMPKGKCAGKESSRRNREVGRDKSFVDDEIESEEERTELEEETLSSLIWSGPRKLWEAGKKAIFGEESSGSEIESMDAEASELVEQEYEMEFAGSENPRLQDDVSVKGKKKKKMEVQRVMATPRRPLRPQMGAARAGSDSSVKRYGGAAQVYDLEEVSGVRGDKRGRSSKPDWELEPYAVSICHRLDGSEWKIGQGGFSEVFKALKDGVDEVALKRIKIAGSTIAQKQFRAEIDLISKLRHRHIVQFYGACTQLDCFYMITELMDGDLFSALHGKDSALYMWTGRHGHNVMRGIASGLNYLHSRSPPVVHRDLKSPNIFLLDGVAKIGDIGLARTKMETLMTPQPGFTPIWSAPEVIYRERAGEKVDIWSLGVILWEVVTGQTPQIGELRLSPSTATGVRKLFGYCMRRDPKDRPDASDVVRSLNLL